MDVINRFITNPALFYGLFGNKPLERAHFVRRLHTSEKIIKNEVISISRANSSFHYPAVSNGSPRVSFTKFLSDGTTYRRA